MKPVGTLTWLPSGVTQPAFEQQTLLVHSMTADLEHAQACGGHAECGTCRVRLVSGALTAMGHEEAELMRDHPTAFRPGERLGCQARPLGDAVVEVLSDELPDLRDA